MKDLRKPRFAAGQVHSAVNVAILLHLQANGPTSVASIGAALVRIAGHSDDTEHSKLRRALFKLRQRRLVHKLDDESSERWAAGQAPKFDAVTVDNPAAPRHVDVMKGPRYTPSPGPVLRAGALDFKALASHGHRC